MFFLYLIEYMLEDLDYTCLISLFACNSCLFFIYISRSHEVLCRIVCLAFQVARIGQPVNLVGIHCTFEIFVKEFPLCILLTSFHCRSIQQQAFPLLFLLSIKINLPVTCLFLLWSDLLLKIAYTLLDLVPKSLVS